MDANGVEAVKVEPNRTGGSSARVGSEYTTPSNGGATDASVPRVSTPIESRGNNDPGGALSDNDDGDDSDTSSMSSTYSYSLPPPLPPSPKREVVRSGALDFKRHTHNSALEVLLGEPRIIIQTPEGETRASAAPIVKPNPRRIRIRSYLIKNVLEDLAREQGRTFIATGAVPPFPPIEFHMVSWQR